MINPLPWSTLQISVRTLEKLLLLILAALSSPFFYLSPQRLERRHSICSRSMELESSVDREEMGKGGRVNSGDGWAMIANV